MVEETEQKIKEMKKYAQENNVPIIQDASMNFIEEYIKNNNIKKILEIGTAIAYSAIMMALVNDEIKIITIERDETRYLEAVKNIKKFNLENRITLIFNDANKVELKEKVDMIFVDAAKSQNKNFFTKFEQNLKDHGTIITDNIEFHGLVKKNEEEIKSRNVRGIVRKIKDYIEFLKKNKDYNTIFYELGDGLAVSIRNK